MFALEEPPEHHAKKSTQEYDQRLYLRSNIIIYT